MAPQRSMRRERKRTRSMPLPTTSNATFCLFVCLFLPVAFPSVRGGDHTHTHHTRKPEPSHTRKPERRAIHTESPNKSKTNRLRADDRTQTEK